MLKVLIVVAIFAFVGLGFYYHNGSRLFPDPHAVKPGSSAAKPQTAPSAVRVLIDGQIWTCQIAHGLSEGCAYTAPSARLRP